MKAWQSMIKPGKRELMTNETVVLYPHDPFVAKIFLPFIPTWIKPNHLTVLRIIMVPPVAVLTWFENWKWLIPVFLIAALTDLLDGTVARVRKQITLWGTIADPVADKLLVGSVAIIFLTQEVSLWLALGLVVLEISIIFGAYLRKLRGVYLSANWFGKIKMVLQVVGLLALFVSKLSGPDWLDPVGVYLIIISMFFAILSLFSYGI